MIDSLYLCQFFDDLLLKYDRTWGQHPSAPQTFNMESEMNKIATNPAKLHGMTKEQSKCEVQYKMAQKMLDILLRRGIVTEEERKKIDELNRQSFSPQLAKVYV